MMPREAASLAVSMQFRSITKISVTKIKSVCYQNKKEWSKYREPKDFCEFVRVVLQEVPVCTVKVNITKNGALLR